MVNPESILYVSDNTLVKKVRCIRFLKNAKSKIGKELIVTARSVSNINMNMRKNSKKFEKGDILYGLLIMTKKMFLRKSLIFYNFNINSIILYNQVTNTPYGTRIQGFLCLELRRFSYMRILLLNLEIDSLI